MGHTAVLTQRLWANFSIGLTLQASGWLGDSWWITAPVKRLSTLLIPVADSALKIFVYLSKCKQKNPVLFHRKTVYRFATSCTFTVTSIARFCRGGGAGGTPTQHGCKHAAPRMYPYQRSLTQLPPSAKIWRKKSQVQRPCGDHVVYKVTT